RDWSSDVCSSDLIDVLLLSRFISSTKHYNHYITMLDVIHSPSSTEEFSHFPNAILERFNVSPISTLNLIYSTIQANTGHIVFNAIQPFIKFWQTFNFN